MIDSLTDGNLHSYVSHTIEGVIKYWRTHEIMVCLFFDSLHSSQQFFSRVGMGLPGLNQY